MKALVEADFASASIMERKELDSGLGPGALLSVLCHAGIACAVLAFQERVPVPPLQVMPVVAIPLGEPSGFAHTPTGVTAARRSPIVRQAPASRNDEGLISPRPSAASTAATVGEAGAAEGGTVSSVEGGLSLGAVHGEDSVHTWYLAGIRAKVWASWVAQVNVGLREPIVVDFAILSDGSVTTVAIVSTNGNTWMELAAKRAIVTASPFAPLPHAFGRDSLTIRAVFQQGP
jgi:TonB family protein